MSIFKDISRSFKKLPKQVSSAVTGKKGLLGKQGPIVLLAKGKVKKAVKATGAAVQKITKNPLIQATYPPAMIPAHLISAAAAKGPKGALAAAKQYAQNPVIKAELAAVAVVFPPVAPASAAGIAAMEATSRIVNGINSKDPKKIASAVIQVAATQAMAKAGSKEAARALNLMKDTQTAQKIAKGLKGAAAIKRIAAQAKAGNPAAKRAAEMVQSAAIRNAAQVLASKNAPPKKALAARKLLTTAQLKKPGLTTGTLTALAVPKGMRLGDFSLLRTGRILYRGKPVREHRAA